MPERAKDYLPKMKKSMRKVFVDTSMFKALVDPQDEFHQTALTIWKKLEAKNVTLITSNYILDETFTLIRKRLGVSTVDEFRRYLTESSTVVKIVRVTLTDEAAAWDWFLKDWSELSFTDCISFAVMKRLGIKNVATFDGHFARAGMEVEKESS